MLTHVDLFSGIGGFSLAAEWAGFRTVVFCEKDKYCQRVLRKWWPEVPIVEDIKDFRWPLEDTECVGRGGRSDGDTEGNDRALQIERPRKSDKCEVPTLLTGGFPCQPFSHAGKRRGKEDNRFLWPQMFRVISEVRPTWILAENVVGIVKMELDNCMSDLESQGYEVQTFIIPACAVDAPHRRDRVWIVANSVDGSDRANRGEVREENGLQKVGGSPLGSGMSGRASQDDANSKGEGLEGAEPEGDSRTRRLPSELRQTVPDSDSAGLKNRLEEHRREQTQGREGECGVSRCGTGADTDVADSTRESGSSRDNRGESGETGDEKQGESGGSDSGEDYCLWSTEPDVGRVAYGIPSRVDRLKCLGNAIVPQVAYEILRCIAKIEDERLK